MTAQTTEARKQAVLARASLPVLLQSAATLEALAAPSPAERMTRAWVFDEIERRAGKITLDEEPEFERVYDDTGSYLAALLHMRPSLTA
ncbi:hypothetical protein SEA_SHEDLOCKHOLMES_96 [Mycobacterium phage ShedlockHolmes]|uniref:Uncharacterized protein n=1 Tax=Mycobacterium phage ShedlockHolmes TaxID=1647313 RepID=A0A0F6WF26_9CAUD|nr:hypothetical protein SEA_SHEDLOCKHOLMES_96 [Mycobacterium phage ShedlockHolmes]AKF15273.1 hypothetical protein SEA_SHEDLOCKHOLMES_96 [Mycobacterium phage ShedlockHolmes]